MSETSRHARTSNTGAVKVKAGVKRRTHGWKESDSAIVAKKPVNKAAGAPWRSRRSEGPGAREFAAGKARAGHRAGFPALQPSARHGSSKGVPSRPDLRGGRRVTGVLPQRAKKRPPAGISWWMRRSQRIARQGSVLHLYRRLYQSHLIVLASCSLYESEFCQDFVCMFTQLWWDIFRNGPVAIKFQRQF